MNTIALSGSARQQIGTKNAAQLRRAKRVPCVLYGGGSTVHFSVEETALRKVVFTPEVNSIELDIDGNKTLALVHQKQFHPLGDHVIHVDFMEIKADRETRALLSLRITGQAPGVRDGGKLNQTMRKLLVKGLPAHIPQHVDVDISGMKLNSSIHVSDLKLEGLTILERLTDVIATVKMPKKVEEVAATAAAVPGAAPVAGAAPAAGDAAKAADGKPAADAKPAGKK